MPDIWKNLSTRTAHVDSNTAADVNDLMANERLMKGGAAGDTPADTLDGLDGRVSALESVPVSSGGSVKNFFLNGEFSRWSEWVNAISEGTAQTWATTTSEFAADLYRLMKYYIDSIIFWKKTDDALKKGTHFLSMKCVCTTGTGGNTPDIQIGHYIEADEAVQLKGKAVSFGFIFKSDVNISDISYRVSYCTAKNNGTYQSSAYTSIATNTGTSLITVKKENISLPDSISGANIDNGMRIDIRVQMVDGGTFYLDFGEFMFNIGATKADFSTRGFAEITHSINRFFYGIWNYGDHGSVASICVGFNNMSNGVNVQGVLTLPIEIIKVPTLRYSNINDFVVNGFTGGVTPTSMGIVYNTLDNIFLYTILASPLSYGGSYLPAAIIGFNGATSPVSKYIFFDARIY